MATTPANAINLTQDELAKWLIEDMPYITQIARIWPFAGIQGGRLSFSRVPALETTSNIDQMATILGDGTTSGIAVKTADGPAVNTTFTLGELAARYKLEYSATDRFKYPNNLDAQQSALSIRRLLYMYFRKLDKDSTGAVGDFPSLWDMCATANQFDSANGTPAARVEELQRAYSLVSSNNGRPNAIMCNSRARRWILAAYNALGMHPETVECEWTDPLKGIVRAPQIAINGTPIFVNDLIASPENEGTFLTRIYFMVLGDTGEAGPSRGITGIVPAPLKDTLFVRRETAEPQGATTTSLTNVDYTFPVATAMGSSGALAVIGNVAVTDYPWHNTGV